MLFFKSKWLLGLLVLAIGWLSYSFVAVKIQEDSVNKEVANLETKAENMEQSNLSLEKFIEYLKHPLYLEREARLKFNYKAPGEEVVFVYPDTDSKSSASINFYNQLAQMPNYLKWVYYVLGY